jgi:exodeoxyribonuclease VII small subunit
MTKKAKTFNFEDSLGTLEGLVESMEQGDLSLEESLKAFEQGIRLTRECQQALEQAEQKVALLVKAGELPAAEPFDGAGVDPDLAD